MQCNSNTGWFFYNGRYITDHTSESTLQVSDFPTFVKGTLTFKQNNGSSIYVRNSVLVIKKSAKLNFTSNIAETGAGISLYDSWMSVSTDCQFVFTNNKAFIKGGAIYAHHSADLYVPHLYSCFIRSDSPSSPPPQNCEFHFTRNTANTKSNSIYATSIIPCNGIENVTQAFCGWKNWTFDGNCSDQIRTSVTNLSSTPDSVTLSPGIPKQFVVGFDDLGHRVEKLPIFPTLWPQSKGNDVRVDYTDDGLTVYANRNTANLTVLIQVGDAQRVVKKLL